MEIFKLVVIFISLSNVSTYYILQPPIDDINSTVVSPPHSTNNATKNSPFYYKSPSNENSTKIEEVEKRVELFDVFKSVFHGASPLQEKTGKFDVGTDTMNVKSSLPPITLAKEEPTKVNDVQNNNYSVSDKNLLHVSSSKIREKDNKLIATSDETDCDASTSLCKSSQECSHGNVCTYVLIFTSSLYFYFTVGAFD